ncbi:hypothetical protein HZB60_12410 [candidate division KSB1 bacterium]|nr:hypothetical protein [candidate division KSB1 bacterium]
MGASEDLISALKNSESLSEQSQRVQRMVEFARKLTLKPSTIGRDDVNALKSVGMSDLEITQVVQVTAYFNYVNRLVDGLGAELEE